MGETASVHSLIKRSLALPSGRIPGHASPPQRRYKYVPLPKGGSDVLCSERASMSWLAVRVEVLKDEFRVPWHVAMAQPLRICP